MYDYPFGLQQLIESIAKCILNAEEKDNEKRISSEKALQVIKSVSYKHNHTLRGCVKYLASTKYQTSRLRQFHKLSSLYRQMYGHWEYK